MPAQRRAASYTRTYGRVYMNRGQHGEACRACLRRSKFVNIAYRDDHHSWTARHARRHHVIKQALPLPALLARCRRGAALPRTTGAPVPAQRAAAAGQWQQARAITSAALQRHVQTMLTSDAGILRAGLSCSSLPSRSSASGGADGTNAPAVRGTHTPQYAPSHAANEMVTRCLGTRTERQLGEPRKCELADVRQRRKLLQQQHHDSTGMSLVKSTIAAAAR